MRAGIFPSGRLWIMAPLKTRDLRPSRERWICDPGDIAGLLPGSIRRDSDQGKPRCIRLAPQTARDLRPSHNCWTLANHRSRGLCPGKEHRIRDLGPRVLLAIRSSGRVIYARTVGSSDRALDAVTIPSLEAPSLMGLPLTMPQHTSVKPTPRAGSPPSPPARAKE